MDIDFLHTIEKDHDMFEAILVGVLRPTMVRTSITLRLSMCSYK